MEVHVGEDEGAGSVGEGGGEERKGRAQVLVRRSGRMLVARSEVMIFALWLFLDGTKCYT